jgi:hypothetical protein
MKITVAAESVENLGVHVASELRRLELLSAGDLDAHIRQRDMRDLDVDVDAVFHLLGFYAARHIVESLPGLGWSGFPDMSQKAGFAVFARLLRRKSDEIAEGLRDGLDCYADPKLYGDAESFRT